MRSDDMFSISALPLPRHALQLSAAHRHLMNSVADKRPTTAYPRTVWRALMECSAMTRSGDVMRHWLRRRRRLQNLECSGCQNSLRHLHLTAVCVFVAIAADFQHAVSSFFVVVEYSLCIFTSILAYIYF